LKSADGCNAEVVHICVTAYARQRPKKFPRIEALYAQDTVDRIEVTGSLSRQMFDAREALSKRQHQCELLSG
jgi:hypothetical protein